MLDTKSEFPEKPTELWRELLDIELKINEQIKNIDSSGPDFLAREEIINQLRVKNNWYKKWAYSTEIDREIWAKELLKLNKYNVSNKLMFYKFLELAEKNYRLALDFIFGEEKNINENLEKIKNDTIEDEIKILRKIKEIKNTEDLMNALINYFEEFKKELIYQDKISYENVIMDTYLKILEILKKEKNDETKHQKLISLIDKIIKSFEDKKKIKNNISNDLP